ncbi:extracellular solute-binding protein [Ruminococcaceae bacterium OttesenSCG-928-L11]|nr:extracellular solute-binding protein [Ruminococcaceae bacterium OttesenSCG-928-L11]
MKGKKLIPLLLASAMVILPLAACSGGGTTSSAPAGSTAASSTASTAAASSQAGEVQPADNGKVNPTGLPIVNEPTTLHIMLNKQVTDLTNSWNEKEAVKRAVEDTGLTFEFTEVSYTAWAEQIGVTLASGSLPDIILYSINNFPAYKDSFLPLNDLLEQYAPNTLAFYSKYPEMRVAGTMEDGQLYSLPLLQQRGTYSNGIGWSINQKWLDNVGMEIPTTTDELYAVLKAFKEQDANGNGDPNDELPISFQASTTNAADREAHGLNMLMASFGIVSRDYVQIEDDTVIFAPTDPRYREFLEYTNKLYTEGLIDPDGFVQQTADFLAKGKAGLIGLFAHHSYADITVGPESFMDYVAMLPMKDSSGNIKVHSSNFNGDFTYDMFKVCKGTENAEAAVRFYDYIQGDEDVLNLWSWGPEGLVYTVADDGKYDRVTEFAEGISNFAYARQTYGAGMAGPWIYPFEMYDRWRNQPRDEKLWEREELYKPYFATMIPAGIDTQEVVERRNEQFIEINTYVQNFTAESIMKGIDDSKWATHLSNCEKLKVAQYTEDYQNFYNEKSALLNSLK